jgi:hypothetical protein
MAVLLPDGVGIRNFVLGGFFQEAAAVGQVHAFHLIEESVLPEYQQFSHPDVIWHKLIQPREYPMAHVVRRGLGNAQMYWVDTPPMRTALNRKIANGSFAYRTASAMADFLGRTCASPGRMQVLDRIHTALIGRSAEVAHYRRLFEQIRPDVIFCSHQRPLQVIAPVIAAKQMGIPASTFIFSWDNLSSKGRIAAPFDHFLLWSEHMRGELHRFYPDVAKDRAHVVGTPQFDPYSDPKLLLPREEFFRRIGADPNRQLICYSGGDEENSKADQYHAYALMKLVREGRIEGNPQVILRPAPIDKGARYEKVRRDFPEMIYAQPDWLFGKTGEVNFLMPKPSDVQFLANLTRHADLNINFASTMTLDFSIHDKPVINVVFEVTDPPLYGESMWDFVRGFEHYDPVVNLGAARFAHTVDEFAAHINAYLKNPSLDREGRRKFVELEVGAPVGESSRLIVETLQKIAGRN